MVAVGGFILVTGAWDSQLKLKAKSIKISIKFWRRWNSSEINLQTDAYVQLF